MARHTKYTPLEPSKLRVTHKLRDFPAAVIILLVCLATAALLVVTIATGQPLRVQVPMGLSLLTMVFLLRELG